LGGHSVFTSVAAAEQSGGVLKCRLFAEIAPSSEK
jgi:hypothetical protein